MAEETRTKSCKVYMVVGLISILVISGAGYLIFQAMKTSTGQVKLVPTTVKMIPILIEVTTLASELNTTMKPEITTETKLPMENIGSTTIGSPGQSESEGRQLENNITAPETNIRTNDTNLAIPTAADGKGNDSNLTVTTQDGADVDTLNKPLEATTVKTSSEDGSASADEINKDISIGNTTESTPDKNLTSTQGAFPTPTTAPTTTVVLE